MYSKEYTEKNDKEQKAINATNNLMKSIYNQRGTELKWNSRTKLWEVLDEQKVIHQISNNKFDFNQGILDLFWSKI